MQQASPSSQTGPGRCVLGRGCAAAAAARDRGLTTGWAILNTRSSVDPFLTFSARRDLRETVWKLFKNRGDNGDAHDTNAIIEMKRDVEGTAGDKLTFTLVRNLTGAGVTGDSTLEDQEESMNFYSDDVTLDQARQHFTIPQPDQTQTRHAGVEHEDSGDLALRDHGLRRNYE